MKEDVFQEKPLFEKYGGFLCTPSPSPFPLPQNR